jgi:hypothetical protein
MLSVSTCRVLVMTIALVGAVFSKTASAQGTMGAVVADVYSAGATIPPVFVGFSSETRDVIQRDVITHDGIFTPNNQSLISLLRLLGPNGVWRIGGNASDTEPAPLLTPQIASDASRFISSVGPGWNTIYGLDGRIKISSINDPSAVTIAVEQARYILNAFPSGSIAFQIGNEPDDPKLWDGGTMDNWLSIFKSYYDALTNTYSGLQFGGPDTDLSRIWWSGQTDLGNGFTYRTGHKYLGCSSDGPFTLDQVLNNASVAGTTYFGATISEFGIICEGGIPGITDRLIAATYYLKLAQSAAAYGYSGIYPHNVLTLQEWPDGMKRLAYYNQFVQQPDGGWSPAPMFFGMYLFAKLEGQQLINISTTLGGSLVSSLATVAPSGSANSGNANILVVNGDTQNEVTVMPDQNKPWSTANLYLLSGQDCTDPNPVLNGVAIGEGGAWAGSPAAISKGQGVQIPPCGAALIMIQPPPQQPPFSLDCSVISGGSESSLITADGTWTFGAPAVDAPGNWSILLNGNSNPGGFSYGSKMEVANGGNLYVLGISGYWWQRSSSDGWTQIFDVPSPTCFIPFNLPSGH